MLTILAVTGAFVAYRLYTKSRAPGVPLLPPSVGVAPAVIASDLEARIKAYADQIKAEILGRLAAADQIKATADLHARAAEAVAAQAPSVPPKA